MNSNPHKRFKWNDKEVIEFVNWYLALHKLDFRYTLENESIVESYKCGDNYKKWWNED